MDLGSGDGRNVNRGSETWCTRSRRGIQPGHGRVVAAIATDEGVADKATFLQGDMYEADISQATVLALFLLLRPQQAECEVPRPEAGTAHRRQSFLDRPAGMRTKTGRADGDCGSWCTGAIVIGGQGGRTWRLPQGDSPSSKAPRSLRRAVGGRCSTPDHQWPPARDQIRFVSAHGLRGPRNVTRWTAVCRARPAWRPSDPAAVTVSFLGEARKPFRP